MSYNIEDFDVRLLRRRGNQTDQRALYMPAVDFLGASVGEPGADGERGSLWYSGAGAPDVITGEADSDHYLNTTNGDVYRLVSGSWSLVGNIRGLQGDQGIQGNPGTDAAQPISATLVADASATATLADITGLSLALTSGVWEWSFYAAYTLTAGTSPSFRYAFTYSGTSNFFTAAGDIQVVDASTVTAVAARALGLECIGGTATTSANNKPAVIRGVLSATGSGDFRVQHRFQGTTPTGATKSGTRLIMRKV